MSETKEINIVLTKNEALVLFEFLTRFNQTDNKEIFEDQAEQKMLWLIESQLEKLLSEPFLPNYIDLIKEARNKLRDEE
jgi:hypothetical protein